MTSLKAIPCWQFFRVVLGLNLTPGQSLIVKVCVDGLGAESLSKDELELVMPIFGVPPEKLSGIAAAARTLCALLLGRGSGKSLICAGIAVYLALTLDVRKAGPGSTPIFAVIAPNMRTAQDVSLSSVRALTVNNPKLSAFVSDTGDDYIQLRRPDGRDVRVMAAAADKGGRTVRGRDILGFILEEAQFFNSDPSGRFIVNDRDVYTAMTPRLMKGSRGFFVSTPWPSENLMSELVKTNFGNPTTCLVAIAPSGLMRPDNEELQAIIEKERLRDPQNAKREFDCDTEAVLLGSFFDPAALRAATADDIEFLDPNQYPVACGVDFAFKSDSSTITVVQYDGKNYNTVYMDEIIPKAGEPLKPSEVVAKFANVAKDFGCRYVIADGFYQEAVKEHLSANGLYLMPAPEGSSGKMKSYLRTKALLDEGKLRIPNNPRLLIQAQGIVAKPAVGGTLTIKAPRRTGFGHGDLVSAWVLAVHHLSYSRVVESMSRPKPGDPGYKAWLDSRIRAKADVHEDRYLKQLEKTVSSERTVRTDSWRR